MNTEGAQSASQHDTAAADSSPAVVSTPSTTRNMPEGWAARQLWLLGVRRKFLVNRRRQLRVAALVLLLAVALLILVNVLFHALRSQETDVIIASAPALREVMADYDRNEMLLGILASVVVLAGVFVVTIIETHRTAGAALNISRQLRRIGDGKYNVQLTLRKGDNLREIEGPFNEMVGSLRNRITEDVEALERLAGVVELQGNDALTKVIAELRALAARKRQLVEPE
jgi:methyl-accepting chemotaxis protein